MKLFGMIVLAATMSATTAFAAVPDANGCVGDCPAPAAAAVAPPAGPSTQCLTLINPAHHKWELVVQKTDKVVEGGQITGTICSGLWTITGGTMTQRHLHLTAVCAGDGCGTCASDLALDGRQSEPKRYHGDYSWNGEKPYTFDAKRHACP